MTEKLTSDDETATPTGAAKPDTQDQPAAGAEASDGAASAPVTEANSGDVDDDGEIDPAVAALMTGGAAAATANASAPSTASKDKTSNTGAPAKDNKADDASEAAPLTAMEEAIDIARTVAIAVGVTLFVRFFFFQPFNIPSGSMKPTLLVGDFVLVDKVEYGYSRASLIFPLTRMPVGGRLFDGAPERGEIAVFKNPLDRNKDYIKRVIGLPGDEIAYLSGVLYINGERVERELLLNVPHTCTSGTRNPKVYRETLPNGTSYIVQACQNNRKEAEAGERWTIPEDHYFMMGDNRDNSQDSRYAKKVGFVHKDHLVGHATRVVFSVDGQESRIWEPWNWPGAIRYGRMFNQVD